MENILYLLNHKTLTDFEVPILNKKGYGVFIPKNYKSLCVNNSINYTTVNFYDNFIHIYIEHLMKLNEVDWFSNKRVSDEIMDIINTHFKCIFITLLTKPPLLNQLVNNFNGNLYYRFFGLDSNKSYVTTVNKISSSKIHYIFSYPEIYEFEKKKSKFFNDNNSHVAELGISNSLVFRLHGLHKRKNNAIAFACSRIQPKCKYYLDIYKKFIEDFKDFEYLIFGKNNEVANDRIRNNLPDDKFYPSIGECACMYYHGKEPRHLHYHPLEAMLMGLPVVFHQESLLSRYLPDSPGKCKNIEEARASIKRIVDKDEEFIKDILVNQKEGCNKLLQRNNLNIFDGIV